MRLPNRTQTFEVYAIPVQESFLKKYDIYEQLQRIIFKDMMGDPDDIQEGWKNIKIPNDIDMTKITEYFDDFYPDETRLRIAGRTIYFTESHNDYSPLYATDAPYGHLLVADNHDLFNAHGNPTALQKHLQKHNKELQRYIVEEEEY